MNRFSLLLLSLALTLPAKAQAFDNAGTYNRTFFEHKAIHFTGGFAIAWGGAKLKHPKLGLALGIGAGIAKEISDNRFGETKMSQRRDILITSAGAALGYWVATRKEGSK